jgi:hypothetical protein
MLKAIGVVLIILALALAIVPFFTDCESQGKMITLENGKQISMKCHWAGTAELGVAVPLLFVGAMLLFARRRENATNLGILSIVLGGMAIAFPVWLIGVCAMPTMTCVTAMKPVLISAGAAAAALGVAAVVLSRLSKRLA